MTTQDISIRQIKISELQDYTAQEIVTAGSSGVVPITPQRALAHAMNPYADKNDVALLAAYCQDECVGYLGILPGKLKTASGLHKVYWVSTIYIDPRHRKSRLVVRLLRAATSLGYDLIGADANDDAQRLYRALRFTEFGPLTYCYLTMEIKSNRSLLSIPFRLFRRVLMIAGFRHAWIDSVIEKVEVLCLSVHRFALYSCLVKRTSRVLQEVAYEFHREPYKASLSSFPCNRASDHMPGFYRGPEVIDWMTHYKWVLSDHEGSSQEIQYAFSNKRNSFEFVHLLLFSRSTSKQIGLLALSLSRRSAEGPRDLKVLDFHIDARFSRDVLTAIVMRAGRRLRADSIIMPEEFSRTFIDGVHDRFGVEIIERPYFCMSANSDGPLATMMPEIALDFCDGDSAFV